MKISLTSFDKTSLYNIGTLKHNEITVYNFNNIYQYIQQQTTKGTFNLDKDSDRMNRIIYPQEYLEK